MQSVQSVCTVLPFMGCQKQRLQHPEACWEDYEIKPWAGHLFPVSCRTVQGVECIRLLLTILLIVTYTVCFIVTSSIKYQRLFHRIRGQIFPKLKPFISMGTHKKAAFRKSEIHNKNLKGLARRDGGYRKERQK